MEAVIATAPYPHEQVLLRSLSLVSRTETSRISRRCGVFSVSRSRRASKVLKAALLEVVAETARGFESSDRFSALAQPDIKNHRAAFRCIRSLEHPRS